MLENNKQDMSKMCNFKYEENWIKANHDKTMEQEEWDKWFSEYCGKCKYMCEICMYGEN